jgi:hypothetical protein
MIFKGAFKAFGVVVEELPTDISGDRHRRRDRPDGRHFPLVTFPVAFPCTVGVLADLAFELPAKVVGINTIMATPRNSTSAQEIRFAIPAQTVK